MKTFLSGVVIVGAMFGMLSGTAGGNTTAAKQAPKEHLPELHRSISQSSAIRQNQYTARSKQALPSAETSTEVKDGTVKIEVTSRPAPQVYSKYGALVSVGVPLLVLLATNLVTLWKIRLDSKAAIRNQLAVARVNNVKEQLTSFYDPILALLNTNSEIFNGFGPRTFPKDPFAGEEAAHIWTLMVNDVILSNNNEVIKIIKSSSHLIHPEDNFGHYLRFMKHATSYSAFRNTPNQLHGDFAYPTDFLPNVRANREKVLRELHELQKELSK